MRRWQRPAAALLAQRARGLGLALADEVSLAVVVLCGEARHASLLSLMDRGMSLLAVEWRMSDRLAGAAHAGLLSVVGPPAVFGGSALPADFGMTACGEEMEFAFANLLFSEALVAGWPWDLHQ